MGQVTRWGMLDGLDALRPALPWPEHLLIDGNAAGDASPLPASQQHMERLGDSSLLYVSVGGSLPVLTVKVEGNASRAAGTALTLPTSCRLNGGSMPKGTCMV